MSPKVFFDFTLPNATTWSSFSLLLAVALFFKFSRFLSMRNWDVVTFYLLVPGLLLLQEAHKPEADASRWLWPAYLCLLCGSAFFLVRCLLDLTLVRRPSLSPNLNQGGLAWLAGTFAVCLISVALRPPQQGQGPAEQGPVGKKPQAVAEVENFVTERVKTVVPQEEEGNVVRPSLALVCHLAVFVALVFVGCRHYQDMHAGLAAGTFYLLLPYTAVFIGRWHVWPAAMIVWAVAAYRKPWISGLLLGLAAGSVYFPALLLPLWISFYRGRGVGRFCLTFLFAAGLGLGIRVWWQGGIGNTLQAALQFTEWQPWKQSFTEGFWHTLYGTSIHWAYRLPVFIAYVALVVVTAFWPNPKNLAHLMALTAALLIGVQFWYADQGGVYVLWYLPLLLLLAFRPNLAERRPPVISPDEDKWIRLRRAVGRSASRWLRGPEQPVKV
jgi:hypothetical protein